MVLKEEWLKNRMVSMAMQHFLDIETKDQKRTRRVEQIKLEIIHHEKMLEARGRYRGSALTHRFKEGLADKWTSFCVPASAKDYAKWLKGYLEKGGNISHYYMYGLPTKDFLKATSDFIITPLYGASSLNVIVPENIEVIVDPDLIGHNSIYFMKEFRTAPEGASFVPCHSDIEKLLED